MGMSEKFEILKVGDNFNLGKAKKILSCWELRNLKYNALAFKSNLALNDQIVRGVRELALNWRFSAGTVVFLGELLPPRNEYEKKLHKDLLYALEMIEDVIVKK